ncbi:MAG TPA: CDGSH iron-sulfur domain-containing protein [Solirubrobacteraceae bacterium]|nr:CDGSH iron-sulfur domain-containing protein [Solirubrobacteraceae bacterium]
MTDAEIRIAPNGPYLVSGGLALSEQALGLDDAGNTWEFVATGVEFPVAGDSYALCRCGASANKPFCDGSHARVGFDGTETASRVAFAAAAEQIQGPRLDLADNPPLCAFARICDGHGRIWDTITSADDDATEAIVEHQGSACPSGRLVVTPHGGDEPLEPAYDPSVVLLEDPQENASGPLWVRGGVTVVGADGTAYETRNRVTLCRCGQSANKPFCDGTHAHVGFRAHD